MSTVFIVGTNHKYQFEARGVTLNDIYQFREYLRAMVSEHAIFAIAEEMSITALQENNLEYSVAQGLSAELGLAHDLSDPEPNIRLQLGIRSRNEIERDVFLCGNDQSAIENEIRHSYGIREEYWISRLSVLGVFPVLFICGADHVRFLDAKLSCAGYTAIILIKNWEPS